MPESHWIALAIEHLDKFLNNKVVGCFVSNDAIGYLYHERQRLIERHAAAYGSEQLVRAQFAADQLAA